MNKVFFINKAIHEYFDSNESENFCKPKDLMPILIKYGAFSKDSRQGLPLRKILRELDDKNEIYSKISYIKIERKSKNRYWFFSNPN